MDGAVTVTGMNTYFGKTAGLVQQAGTVSHFQRAVLRIGNFLILITAGLVAIIVLAGLFRHNPLLELVQFALILAVASIPVALPAVLSVTMAVGAERLARMKAIVSRLVSIEEMAGVDTLCSDKTGTLTKNELTLGEPQPAKGVQTEEPSRGQAGGGLANVQPVIDVYASTQDRDLGAIADTMKVLQPFEQHLPRGTRIIVRGQVVTMQSSFIGLGLGLLAAVEGKGHVVTAVLIGMVAMLFTAISYGRMANAYPSAGSAYAYVSREIHPALGYFVGWSIIFDYVMNPIICVDLDQHGARRISSRKFPLPFMPSLLRRCSPA